MQNITVSAARRNFGALLDKVQSGEEFAIKRRGMVVARLTPALGASNHTQAQAAVGRIRARAAKLRLGDFHWEQYKADQIPHP